MTININEYTIITEHNKFWTCTDCIGEKNNNYYYYKKKKRIDFYNPSKYNCSNRYFHFYFQINSPSELEYKNNIVNNNFYAFTSQKYFYITIENLEDEINLINFNTINNFYIK